jgi:hypothetical protein
VGAIDFFRLHSEIGGAAVNVQSFIELAGIDLLPDVVCEPGFARIDKNNGKRLVYFFVPVDECAGGGSGFEAEDI